MKYTKINHENIGRLNCGFTLIELLVVIAITVLLMSILLPALAKAQKMTRKTVCLSNIRHLAVANHLYSSDNDEFFVLAAEGLWAPNLKRWHGQRNSVSKPFDPKLSPMISQMGSAGLKQCPCFIAGINFSDEAGQDAGFEAGCGGYGYNSSYIGGRNDLYGCSPTATLHSARVSDVANSGETTMFTDAAYVSTVDDRRVKIAYSFCEPPFWQLNMGPPSNLRPDPTIDFRHMGQCNVAWVDGHAKSLSMSFTYSYKTHSVITGEEAAKEGVGWFGPDSNEWFDLN